MRSRPSGGWCPRLGSILRGAISAQVTICGHSVRKAQLDLVFGYCPQFDALWDRITVEEHIKLYAAVKGVSSSYMRQLVDG